MTSGTESPILGSTWEHPAYGRAVVVTISRYFSTGGQLVTVQYDTSGKTVFPAEFCSYPLEDFLQRFEAVTR